MNDLDEYVQQKKEMGQRFKKFRELMGKSRNEIEQEANHRLIMTERIKMFEYGVIVPDIMFIQYFTEEYGLNLTWLVKGIGSLFTKKGAKTPEDIYMIFRDIEYPGQLINEVLRLTQNEDVKNFREQKPQNWSEVEGRMMW
jgi:transcriptional regulator with XRE-family HTH domain